MKNDLEHDVDEWLRLPRLSAIRNIQISMRNLRKKPLPIWTQL
ncbi:hypothetical protein [Treponema parvum]|nr:hypothetical protein [Treponema parvum]